MLTDPAPTPMNQRCPRCDEVLKTISVGHGSARSVTLACPELYCDYIWSPSPRELARMTRRRRAAADQGESVKRAAG